MFKIVKLLCRSLSCTLDHGAMLNICKNISNVYLDREAIQALDAKLKEERKQAGEQVGTQT